MKTQQRIADLSLGIITVAIAPLIALALISVILRHVGIPMPRDAFGQRVVIDLITATVFVAPLSGIWIAARWRIKHRQSPLWTAWLEVPAGLAVAFGIYCFVRWVWFYPSLTW